MKDMEGEMLRLLQLICTVCLLGTFVAHAISDADWANAVKTHYKTYGIDTPPPGTQRAEMEQQLSALDAQLAALRRTSMGSWENVYKIYLAKADVYLSYRQYSGALLYCNAALYLLKESLPEASSYSYRIPVLEKKLTCLINLGRMGEARQVQNKLSMLQSQVAPGTAGSTQIPQQSGRDMTSPAAAGPRVAQQQQPSLGTAQSARYMLPLYKCDAENGSAEALAWLEAQAKNGNTDAMCVLAELYLEGRGVSRDEQRAMEWYEAACGAGSQRALEKVKELADDGNAEAQYLLAQFFSSGSHVSADVARAVQYYAMAAAQSHTQALAWLEAQAAQTNIDAQCALADLYLTGRGVAKDEARALAMYRAASAAGSQRALNTIKQLADKGNSAAQVMLGELYAGGTGIRADMVQAVKYYTMAAAQSHTQALAWLEAQAAQTNIDAQCALADLYLTGRGVAKDEARALAMYRAASAAGSQRALNRIRELADKGNSGAQVLLGELYAGGTGIRADMVQAVKYYTMAAAQSHTQALAWLEAQAAQTNAEAQCALADLYLTGRGVAQDEARALALYQAALQAGTQRAFDSIKQHAQRGSAAAQYLVGTLIISSGKQSQPYSEALRYFRMAAEQGYGAALDYFREQVWVNNPTAAYVLGELYRTGAGVQRNEEEAWKLHGKAAELGFQESWNVLKNAAQRGYASAHCTLAAMYELGRGTVTNYTLALTHYENAARLGATNAVEWLRESAQKGDARAQCTLGALYLHGAGVSSNAIEAVKWYQMAAEQKDPEGVFQLGYLYETGQGVLPDAERAVALYTQAVQLKHPRAKQRLRALIGVE